MAFQRIMGQNFRAFVGGATSAYAVVEETNCSVNIQGNFENTQNKDTASLWNTDTMTSKQWSVQVDELECTAARLKAIINQFNSDQTVTVGWDQTSPASSQNRSPVADCPFAYTGQAYLVDVNISAPNRQLIQISLQYQGTGALN